MRIGNKDIPCGCEARQKIMFDEGNMDKRDFLLGFAMVAVFMLAIYKVTH